MISQKAGEASLILCGRGGAESLPSARSDGPRHRFAVPVQGVHVGESVHYPRRVTPYRRPVNRLVDSARASVMSQVRLRSWWFEPARLTPASPPLHSQTRWRFSRAWFGQTGLVSET